MGDWWGGLGPRAGWLELKIGVPAGNSPKHTGLVHAAFPEHSVAAGGTVGARSGCDALSSGPLQVSVAILLVPSEGAEGAPELGKGKMGLPLPPPALSRLPSSPHPAVPLAGSK